MQSGIVLSNDEVRHIIAEHFNVNDEEVIKAKFSYIVLNVKCDEIIKEEENGRHSV